MADNINPIFDQNIIRHNLIEFQKLNAYEKFTVSDNYLVSIDNRYFQSLRRRTDNWIFYSSSSRESTYQVIKLTYQSLQNYPQFCIDNDILIIQSLDNLALKLSLTYPDYRNLLDLIKVFLINFTSGNKILDSKLAVQKTYLKNPDAINDTTTNIEKDENISHNLGEIMIESDIIVTQNLNKNTIKSNQIMIESNETMIENNGNVVESNEIIKSNKTIIENNNTAVKNQNDSVVQNQNDIQHQKQNYKLKCTSQPIEVNQNPELSSVIKIPSENNKYIQSLINNTGCTETNETINNESINQKINQLPVAIVAYFEQIFPQRKTTPELSHLPGQLENKDTTICEIFECISQKISSIFDCEWKNN